MGDPILYVDSVRESKMQILHFSPEHLNKLAIQSNTKLSFWILSNRAFWLPLLAI